jgi:hypothetical protein
MDIKDQDCRVTGYVVGTRHYLKAVHMPTGATVDVFHDGSGWRQKALEALQIEVDRHMDAELAKLR